ncbi:MAG: TRAP transporter substrate-binding protein [Nocardioides sp.]
MRTFAAAVVTIVTMTAVAGLAACNGATDKAGNDTRVLHLASIDLVDNNGYAFGPSSFVRALPEVSGGRLQVEVQTDWGGGAARAEADLVEAIGRGDVDGGWPSPRAFAEAGIPGLAALETPMMIASYDDQRRIATGEAGAVAVDALDGTDLVGLGLAVGPLRRPFGVERFLTSRSAWADVAFRSYGSPGQDAAIRALGATPRRAGREWVDQAQEGMLDGAEFDLAQYLANGYVREAPYVAANLVLWPKMYLLTFSRRTWDDLSGQERRWVRAAAARAVADSVSADYEEPLIAKRLCDKGVRFGNVGPRELSALRDAWRPLVRQLAADPAERPLLDAVRAAVGPRPAAEPIMLDRSCGQDDISSAPEAIPRTVAPVPDGTYRKQITLEDVAGAGLTNNDGLTGTWTLTVKDGRYELRCRPIDLPGTDCGGEVSDAPLDTGELRGDDETLWWVYDAHRLAEATGCLLPVSDLLAGHCGALESYRMSWELRGRDLVLSDATGGAGEATLKDYRRID